jgi:hypothetical protein
MGNTQNFMAIWAKIDITSAQECPQFPEGDRRELRFAMGTEGGGIIFFHKSDHFNLLNTFIPLEIRPKRGKYFRGNE